MSDSYNANRLREDSRIARPEGFKPFDWPARLCLAGLCCLRGPCFYSCLLGPLLRCNRLRHSRIVPLAARDPTQPARSTSKREFLTLHADATHRMLDRPHGLDPICCHALSACANALDDNIAL